MKYSTRVFLTPSAPFRKLHSARPPKTEGQFFQIAFSWFQISLFYFTSSLPVFLKPAASVAM